MRKEYPAFIIDRSRRSMASRFTDDFVVCTDKEVGFIARAYMLPKSRRAEFDMMLESIPEYERQNRYIMAVIGDAFVVLEIIKMLYEPVAHINRLRPLMKKALRAYLHGEAIAVKGEETPYDEQISAIEELLRALESQYPQLVDLNGKSAADRRLKATRAAVGSLKLLKGIIKSE